MAKKKEEIVDLKPKAEKISKEQLDKVQKTINNINKFQLEIGGMELRKHEMMHSIAGLKDELSLMQTEFEKEYGTSNINIQDGTINYKDEQTDKKD